MLALAIVFMGMKMVASAASPVKYGDEAERQSGYISMEKILVERERYGLADLYENESYYIDYGSIRRVRDDRDYKELNYKYIAVLHDYGIIGVYDSIFRYNMINKKEVADKTNYTHIYDMQGNYMTTVEPASTDFTIIPDKSPLATLANILYIVTEDASYDDEMLDEIVDRIDTLEAEGELE